MKKLLPKIGEIAVSERALYVDQVPEPDRSYKVVTVSGTDSIRSLYGTYFGLKAPVNLLLDCRGLDTRRQAYLLKFFEEYSGGLKVLLEEPVIGPIISRFNRFNKSVTKPRGSLLGSVFDKYRQSEKLKSLFQIRG